MKFGYHAEEDENNIIKRKILEFKNSGLMFWGYGGVLCHPIKQAQPFAKSSNKVHLLMSFTPSRPNVTGEIATQYSVDGTTWLPIPKGIEVRGSKYALVCNSLREVDFEINLCNYEVAIGKSRGKNASEYIKYRVDKGCLIKSTQPSKGQSIQRIKLVTELSSPFAVLLK